MGAREWASAAVGLAAAIAAILIWTVGGKHTPRLVVALVITASVGFLNTRLGSWIRIAFGWIQHLLGSAMGWLFGATVLGGIAFVCAYIVAHDTGLVHRLWSLVTREGSGGGGGLVTKVLGPETIGTRTLVTGGVLPFAAIGLPGWVGTAVYTVLGWVSALIGWGLGALFGIH